MSIKFDPAKSFLERWDAQADAQEAIRGLADWICKYTYLEDAPFSFKDHEYQIQIANDTHPRLNAMKASQVGLTELQARILLAYVATHGNRRALYGLPTTTFAQSFSKDRIALVIEGSPKLREMVASKNDTVLQKVIGTSVLYLQGLSGKTAGFSLPLFLLVVDEVDICDQEILSRANSRLRHAPLDETGRWRGLRRYFGTPTVLDYGIHHQIKLSDQHHYLVKCEHCGHMQAPSIHDFVIPGFEKDFQEFEISDVYDPLIDIDNAYMACQKCKRAIDESLKNPENRQWVPAKTETGLERGYIVAPWDLPVYNTTQSILRQRADYKSKAEYYNQILGLPYEDSDNSFLLSVFNKTKKAPWLDPESPFSGRLFVGVDVGKTFHVMVIRPTGLDECEVVYATTLNPKTVDGELKTNAMQVVDLCKKIRARGCVIDSGPDFTSASYVTAHFSRGYASEYVRSVDDPLANFKLKEERRTVKIARTGMLEEVMRAHNSGKIVYPNRGNIRETFKTHFQSLKLVRSEDPSGMVTRTFIKTKPLDHYVHALGYAWAAWEIFKSGLTTGSTVGHVPSVSTLKVGEARQSSTHVRSMFRT